jgi:hypothetical protein
MTAYEKVLALNPNHADLVAEKADALTHVRRPQDAIEQMAAEFRSLRVIPGHFTGGLWKDDVDRWMGRKHELMLKLGSRLAGGEYDQTDIINLLGPPDNTVRRGDRLFDQINRRSSYKASTDGSYKFLVYYWRGKHDFLFFTCQDNFIISSDWWYAGD